MLSSFPENFYRDVEKFIFEANLVKLYQDYSWGRDTWESGFIDIFNLENLFSSSLKEDCFFREHILSVASWGRLRNPGRIKCPETIPFFRSGGSISEEAVQFMNLLKANISGMGPTYFSKILRFAFPSAYGAIDTRLVRVFGLGDADSKRQNWLTLKVRNDGYGWYIPEKQSAWPSDYGYWINTLNLIADTLNNNGVRCPHPRNFENQGLRSNGVWTSADVEMALFTYASSHIKK